MRFDVRIWGERRVKRFFALFPVRTGYEIRWLEIVTVEQVYRDRWYNERFIDKGDITE
jgi:hypothetical protein